MEIVLTNAEYRLLEYFLRHPDRVIARADLLAELGNDLSLYMDRTIDVLILRLRRKIEPVHLQTRGGWGMCLFCAPVLGSEAAVGAGKADGGAGGPVRQYDGGDQRWRGDPVGNGRFGDDE